MGSWRMSRGTMMVSMRPLAAGWQHKGTHAGQFTPCRCQFSPCTGLFTVMRTLLLWRCRSLYSHERLGPSIADGPPFSDQRRCAADDEGGAEGRLGTTRIHFWAAGEDRMDSSEGRFFGSTVSRLWQKATRSALYCPGTMGRYRPLATLTLSS